MLDAHVLRWLAAIIQKVMSGRSDLRAVADQLVGRILEEIDYRHEAAYATRFGQLYRSEVVVVPRILQSHSTSKVITTTATTTNHRRHQPPTTTNHQPPTTTTTRCSQWSGSTGLVWPTHA